MARKSGRLAGRRLLRLGLLAIFTGALATSLTTPAAEAGDQRGPTTERPARSRSLETPPGMSIPVSAPASVPHLSLKLTAICTDETGVTTSRQFPSGLAEIPIDGANSVRRLVAVPDCDAVTLRAVTLRTAASERQLEGSAALRVASVDEIVRIRDQAVAVVRLNVAAIKAIQDPADPWTGIDVSLTPIGDRGPSSKNTGPFTRVCERTLLNYDAAGEAAPVWTPPGKRGTRTGSVDYCGSVSDCAAAGTDVLFLVAEDLAFSGALLGFAVHHASYLGLNVGIVNVGALAELSAEQVRGFVQGVYDTQSAEHFGDGHLGFVLLVGDAYADDNQTVMVPIYDGYGGTEVASDHYYACVSGDDDFEDVMIGRLSVGNPSELTAVLGKAANYMPQDPQEDWYKRVLLVGGLFYTMKDEYVALFDEYEDIIPEDVTVDRIYRHDFSTNDDCALAVVDAVNDGYLFVNYAGDGWKFTWAYTLNAGHVPLMVNSDRLPIVLSMACMTGWFDNTTDADAGGSYDCLAEQMVNTPGGGAVACLAAPRSSDGGIFRTITKKMYSAAFEENCVFLGETMAVAKLLHLQDNGDVAYARHFNLFGDPTLIFASDAPPVGQPDLVVRPHDVRWTPELPGVGHDLTVTVPVHNQSTEPAEDVAVRLSRVSGSGSHDTEAVIPLIEAWSLTTVEFVLPLPDIGDHILEITIDPDDEIAELHEDNNSFERPGYVYPHLPGFPVDTGVALHGPCVAYLSGAGKHILVSDENASMLALANDGSVSWQTPAGAGPITFGREIAPAIGDIDGDGTSDIVFTRRMALAGLDSDGDELWMIPTSEPLGYPVLADADGDGDLDVLLSTIGVFGSPCEIVAVDEDGQEIWAHELPSGQELTTCPVAGDFDLDGVVDIAYGTSDGKVAAISCAENPPVGLWGPIDLGTSEITVLGLGDLEGDGLLELVVGDETVMFLNAEDGTSLGWDLPIGPGVVTLALGDTNGDGIPEVVVGTSSGNLHLVSGGTESWSVLLSGVPGMSAALADVDGDGAVEILVGTDAGYIHVLTASGEDYVSPIPIPGGCSTPFVGNLTGDTRQELVVSSHDGMIFAFGFDPGVIESVPEWAGLGRSARRGGVHVQPIGGTLTNDTILAGRYRVTEDVIVDAAVTLTLAAETILEFESDPPRRLEVNGAIEAVCHPGYEIVMTGSPSGPRSSWGGIELGPGSVAELTRCRISDASTAIDGRQASVTVADCEFTDNGTGVKLVGCSLNATDCALSQSDSVGMYIDGGTGTITGCDFDANGAAGIECKNSGGHEIRSSTFSGALHGDGVRLTRYSDATIDSCVFSENASSGILLKSSSPTIRGSSFTDNGSYGVHCVRLASPDISWCTITGNRIGVVSEAGSNPNLGNDMQQESGYNQIMDNQIAAAANYVDPHVPIYARRNWWGTPTPYGRIFIGYVAYAPWLTEPPDDGILEVRDAELPTSFRLFQNSPNPFNRTTTITFDAPPVRGDVDISVYDVSGRRVATLHSGECPPGTHATVWDGRDDLGNRVASGTYFVRMSAPDHTSTRKIILLK